MARFQEKSGTSGSKKLYISLLLFVFILLLFSFGMDELSQQTRLRQKEQLEAAISRAITYSYATEGYYPQSLEELVHLYGVSYNTDLFYVDYRSSGGNLFPEITVLINEEEN